jgi:hypothetical protein
MNAVTPQSYASQVNSKYLTNNSVFVDAKDRLNQTISNLPGQAQNTMWGRIKKIAQHFTEKFPDKKKFEDLEIVESIMMPMSDILIDTTMQRQLNLAWVLYIIANFREVMAQPIQIYRVVNPGADLKYYPVGKLGLYASWDAQHTLLALYIIAVYVFGQDPAKVMVPVNIYKVSKKADIRENFIAGNSDEGKKLLDDIDIFMQQVFGVMVDGSQNPRWKESAEKQRHLAAADLFVTHDKFNDTHMPGAISRMQEVKHYDSEIVRKFTVYATAVMPNGVPNRPVASQEIEIMCAWFHMAKQGGVEYTDAQIVDLADHLNTLFGADFHESSIFWIQTRAAYSNWHTKYWSRFPADEQPKHMSFSKNWRNGGAFLWHQLRKTWNGPVPKMNYDIAFKPAEKDLF